MSVLYISAFVRVQESQLNLVISCHGLRIANGENRGARGAGALTSQLGGEGGDTRCWWAVAGRAAGGGGRQRAVVIGLGGKDGELRGIERRQGGRGEGRCLGWRERGEGGGVREVRGGRRDEGERW